MRTVENPDGMFTREKIPLGELTPEDHRALKVHFDMEFNYDQRCVWILEQVEAIEKEATDADTRVDARYIQSLIKRQIPAVLKNGDTKTALALAINVGMDYERLALRLQFDPDVQHEHKCARSHGPALAKQKKDRMTKCLETYDAIVANTPGIKQSIAAKRCKVSERTLRGYLKTRKSGKG